MGVVIISIKAYSVQLTMTTGTELAVEFANVLFGGLVWITKSKNNFLSILGRIALFLNGFSHRNREIVPVVWSTVKKSYFAEKSELCKTGIYIHLSICED